MKKAFINQQLINRRAFLRNSFLLGASTAFGLTRCILNSSDILKVASLGNLMELPDENGILLPKGLKSRIIARSGLLVEGSVYPWHEAPDGGACFSNTQGWVYVSNSEKAEGLGGVGAIQFDAQGNIVNAYSILQGSSSNCSGGAMPWGTWLSCEESGDLGRVFECDPMGEQDAIERPALGRFNHEAIAYDPETQYLYLTEDRADGGLYRFIAHAQLENGYPDLSAGVLQVALLVEEVNTLTWHDVPDPQALTEPTRYQVSGIAEFKGAEGICYFQRVIYFTTKLDNRVWAYDTASHQIIVLYEAADFEKPVLSGVDNITITPSGQLVVAEDGGDLQLVLLSTSGEAKPLLQLVGHKQSEITGPAFSPDGTRLYFSSQRGESGKSSGGITYEISGVVL